MAVQMWGRSEPNHTDALIVMISGMFFSIWYKIICYKIIFLLFATESFMYNIYIYTVYIHIIICLHLYCNHTTYIKIAYFLDVFFFFSGSFA